MRICVALLIFPKTVKPIWKIMETQQFMVGSGNETREFKQNSTEVQRYSQKSTRSYLLSCLLVRRRCCYLSRKYTRRIGGRWNGWERAAAEAAASLCVELFSISWAHSLETNISFLDDKLKMCMNTEIQETCRETLEHLQVRRMCKFPLSSFSISTLLSSFEQVWSWDSCDAKS